MEYFVEIAFYDEPKHFEIFDTIEESAEYYTQAIDATRSYGVHFGDWAQIRLGKISNKGRKIMHRHTNEVIA